MKKLHEYINLVEAATDTTYDPTETPWGAFKRWTGAGEPSQLVPGMANPNVTSDPSLAAHKQKLAAQAQKQAPVTTTAQPAKKATTTTTAAATPPAGGSATQTPVKPAAPKKPAFVDQGKQFGYDTPEEVQKIQSQLKSMGYDIAVDGKFGQKTLAAYNQAYGQMYGQQPGQADPNAPTQGASTTPTEPSVFGSDGKVTGMPPAKPQTPQAPQASTDELLSKAAEFTKAGDLTKAKLYTDLAARQGAKLREDIELSRIIDLAKLK